MAKQLSTAQWLGRLHRDGRSDAEIGAALNRSPSFIQKVRTGVKPGTSLRPAARTLATNQARRSTGTARPLRAVAAPRRAQEVRRKESKITADRKQRF
jgi:hypothetical protein